MQTSSMTMVEISEAEALQAAREFAAVLAETREYQVFDRAQHRLRLDAAAQAAIRAFQEKQGELGWRSQVGLIGDAEREELRRLQQAMLGQPAVRAYADAQERLGLLCREVSETVSEVIGLSFAASCGPGCC